MSKRFIMLSIVAVAILAAIGSAIYMYRRPTAARLISFRTWINNPASRPNWKLSPVPNADQPPLSFPLMALSDSYGETHFAPVTSTKALISSQGPKSDVTRVIAAYPRLSVPPARLEIIRHSTSTQRPAQSRQSDMVVLHPYG